MKPRCTHDLRRRYNVFMAIVLLCLIPYIKYRKSACVVSANRIDAPKSTALLLLFVAGICFLVSDIRHREMRSAFSYSMICVCGSIATGAKLPIVSAGLVPVPSTRIGGGPAQCAGYRDGRDIRAFTPVFDGLLPGHDHTGAATSFVLFTPTPPGSLESRARRTAFRAAYATDRPGGRSRWREFPACRYDRRASGRATGGCPRSGRAAQRPKGRRGTPGCRDRQVRSGA